MVYLWFYIGNEGLSILYSYKNCYGLSITSGKYPVKKLMVFVQELLWFILQCYAKRVIKNTYSYKNCYGLSAEMWGDMKQWLMYSYKNCYGLSFVVGIIQAAIMPVFVQELLWFISSEKWKYIMGRAVFVQELLWFINKKTYDWWKSTRVFVQELLWFIPCKIKVCIFSIA